MIGDRVGMTVAADLSANVFAAFLLILIVRLWANYVPGHVWVIYAIFGVVFSAGGFVLFRKANRIEPAPDH